MIFQMQATKLFVIHPNGALTEHCIESECRLFRRQLRGTHLLKTAINKQTNQFEDWLIPKRHTTESLKTARRNGWA